MTTIPFLERFHEPVRTGRKTMTARTKKYGVPGDILQGPGCELQLLDVRREDLGTIARDHYKEEGLDSPEDFISVWAELHPRHGFVPGMVVWLHTFEVIA